jgi:copper oxidase (laccase) domain-containing protein
VADGAVTACPGFPLIVLTADCAPIALAVDEAVAAVHAGWRGLLSGIVDQAVATLRAVGSGPVRAVIGPCIQPARYAFGRADLETVAARIGPEALAETAEGEPALDLPGALRAELARAGVVEVAEVGICTAGDRHHFSFRRDGTTGRQAMIVVLEDAKG